MSSKQEGGRKISGEEKNLANQQANLLGLETSRLQQLQSILQGRGPGELAQLGLNAQGGLLQPGQLPAAPTASVADPGSKPAAWVFSGRNYGKNDKAAKARSDAAIADWEKKNAAYQQDQQRYQGEMQAYSQQVQQIQANPDAYYLQDPNVGRQQEQGIVDQIMQGSLSSEAAAAQGGAGGEAAGRAGFLQMLNKYLGTNTDEDRVGGQALSRYEQRLGGDVPEATQLQGFLDRLTRGISGDTFVNPDIERRFQEAEQERRTRLFSQLGSGYETSSAGIEALSAQKRSELGARDELNRADLQQSLGGYLGLSQNVDAQTQNLLNQYLGLQQNKRSNLDTAFTGYAGLTDFTEQNRQNRYTNELNNRMGRVGISQQIATQPYQVDYTGLINSYTGALSAATQRQTGPVQQGGGWQGALGNLAGTAVGAGIGFAAGGPFGASMGSQLGGMAGMNSQGYNLYS